MGSFGERLQREREMRGITLEEIAEATKIGTRSLRALEEQDFDKLPGGIFNKGFVRAYARYLGLNEEQAVADYLGALSEAQAAGKATRQEPIANAAVAERNIVITEVEESEPVRLPLGLIAVVALIAILLFGGWRYYARYGLPNLRHVRAANQPSAATAPRTAPLSGQVAAPPEEGFIVRVRAKENVWVSIVADGKPVMSGMLATAGEKSVHAQRSVVLKTGNAAGIDLFHNDKPVPPLGSAGQVRTVEFTPSGVKQ